MALSTRILADGFGGHFKRLTPKDRRWLFSFCASRLPESEALTRSVLIHEFNSGFLESSSYCRFVGVRDWNLSI
jgi:hypothetical protein